MIQLLSCNRKPAEYLTHIITFNPQKTVTQEEYQSQSQEREFAHLDRKTKLSG